MSYAGSEFIVLAVFATLACGVAAVLSAQLRRRNREARCRSAIIELLEAAAVSANNAVNLEAALQACLDAVCMHSCWRAGHAYVHCAEGQPGQVPRQLWHAGGNGYSRNSPLSAFCRVGEAAALSLCEEAGWRALRERRAAWAEGLSAASPSALQRAAVAAGLRSAFAFPVIVENEAVAVLEFFAREKVRPGDDLLDAAGHLGILLARVQVRQRGLAAVAEAEHRYRSALQAAPAALVILDEKARIAFWNPRAEALFGYTAAQTVGRDLAMILPPQCRNSGDGAMAGFLAAAAESGPAGRAFELEGLHRDGRVLPVELALSGWRSGERSHFVGVIRDTAIPPVSPAERLASPPDRRRTSRGAVRLRGGEISLLREMTMSLHACIHSQQLNETVTRIAAQLMPRCAGDLYLYGEISGRLEGRTGWGKPPPRRADFVTEECWALRTGKPSRAEPGDGGTRCPHLLGEPGDCLCLPLATADEAFGLLLWREGPGMEPGRLADKQSLLASFAEQVALALRGLKLRALLRRGLPALPATAATRGFFVPEGAVGPEPVDFEPLAEP